MAMSNCVEERPLVFYTLLLETWAAYLGGDGGLVEPSTVDTGPHM